MTTATSTKPESAKITEKLTAAKEQAAPTVDGAAQPARKPYRAPRPKQTRPAGPRKLLPLTIGGVEVTVEEAVAAIDILETAPGIMVRQPLVKARNPLSECNYHSVANAERENPGSESLATKPAFVKALRKLTGR